MDLQADREHDSPSRTARNVDWLWLKNATRIRTVSTESDDVAWLIKVMVDCGADPIVAGGWGVDALAGRQSRIHRDLDALVQNESVEPIRKMLISAGFSVTTDWLPVRIEFSDAQRDRHLDVHPIFADGRGGWWQHGVGNTRFEYPAVSLTTGHIGATTVQCLTVSKQRDLHAGYEPRGEDIHDLGVLDALHGAESP